MRRKILFKCIFHPENQIAVEVHFVGFWPVLTKIQAINEPSKKKTIFIQYFTVLILFFVSAVVGNDVHVVATCCCYCCLLCCCIKTVSFSSGRCRPNCPQTIALAHKHQNNGNFGRSGGWMVPQTDRQTDGLTADGYRCALAKPFVISVVSNASASI